MCFPAAYGPANPQEAVSQVSKEAVKCDLCILDTLDNSRPLWTHWCKCALCVYSQQSRPFSTFSTIASTCSLQAGEGYHAGRGQRKEQTGLQDHWRCADRPAYFRQSLLGWSPRRCEFDYAPQPSSNPSTEGHPARKENQGRAGQNGRSIRGKVWLSKCPQECRGLDWSQRQ